MTARSDSTAAEEFPHAVARARFVRVSPMKARRVVELIKGRSAADALAVLQFAPQTASGPVSKVLASAIANAENNLSLDPDTLVVRHAYVDEGPTLKRFRPRAQGRAYRIRKRTCHITIAVEAVAPATPKKKAAKRTTAQTAPAATEKPAAEATATEQQSTEGAE